MVQSFAIVPAAGRSRRMGADKLLLPWQGRPIIEHVLGAWCGSAVTRTVVVVRHDDEPLRACCRRFDVDLVAPPSAPLDMKASVRLALGHIEANYAPAPSDAWLLAPADMPTLSSGTIDLLLAQYDAEAPTAVVPAIAGRRGHPLLTPWFSAQLVHDLEFNEGVNSLLKSIPVREAACHDASILKDLDTQGDYARLVETIN